ncbi:MAG: hypothetical protein K2X86_04145 [Cytophagaceae bacterium]|nr:hypothetical protein [Cytophagaceae bacterium]
MKKFNIYFLIAGTIALLSGCAASLQTYDLNTEYATSLHYEGSTGGGSEEEEDESGMLVGIPAKTFYGGDLKRGGIWWAGKGITLEKGDFFTITANSIGSDSIPFGATFPPIDLLVDEVVLKISARAEGKDGDMPVLYLQVADAGGYQANAKRPFQKIENSGEFKDYYFDLKDIYLQSAPKKHKVNGAMINSLKFFINPGQTPYTGKIFIKEIKVIPAASAGK